MKTVLMAASALALSAGFAAAAPIFATEVISFNEGAKTTILPGRDNPAAALGAPNVDLPGFEDFVSLGFGGDITLGFGVPLFGAGSTTTTYEITFNPIDGHGEAVDVFAVLGLSETKIGTVLNNLAQTGQSIVASVPFQYLKLVDVTQSTFPTSASFDGFDLNSVSVEAIPLPATALLLMAGIAGLGAIGRKRS